MVKKEFLACSSSAIKQVCLPVWEVAFFYVCIECFSRWVCLIQLSLFSHQNFTSTISGGKYLGAAAPPHFLVVTHGLWIHAFLAYLNEKRSSFLTEMPSSGFDFDRNHVANTARTSFRVELSSRSGEIKKVICTAINEQQHLETQNILNVLTQQH